MSGGAGDNEITITAAQNETLRIATVDVGAFRFRFESLQGYDAERRTNWRPRFTSLGDLSYEEQIIEVPLVSNVEYKVNISAEAQEWISQVESKAEPVKDTLYFKIETYRTGLLRAKRALR